jgi:hypothetical protein
MLPTPRESQLATRRIVRFPAIQAQALSLQWPTVRSHERGLLVAQALPSADFGEIGLLSNGRKVIDARLSKAEVSKANR